jgi:hypothetical protein
VWDFVHPRRRDLHRKEQRAGESHGAEDIREDIDAAGLVRRGGTSGLPGRSGRQCGRSVMACGHGAILHSPLLLGRIAWQQ